jgi:hypothetical protein
MQEYLSVYKMLSSLWDEKTHCVVVQKSCLRHTVPQCKQPIFVSNNTLCSQFSLIEHQIKENFP